MGFKSKKRQLILKDQSTNNFKYSSKISLYNRTDSELIGILSYSFLILAVCFLLLLWYVVANTIFFLFGSSDQLFGRRQHSITNRSPLYRKGTEMPDLTRHVENAKSWCCQQMKYSYLTVEDNEQTIATISICKARL